MEGVEALSAYKIIFLSIVECKKEGRKKRKTREEDNSTS